MSSRTVNIIADSASAKLRISDEGVATLSNVFSREPRKGHATSLMETVCKMADDESLIIILEARAYHYRNGEGLDNRELALFYQKFGFRVIPGDRRSTWMRRYPKLF